MKRPRSALTSGTTPPPTKYQKNSQTIWNDSNSDRIAEFFLKKDNYQIALKMLCETPELANAKFDGRYTTLEHLMSTSTDLSKSALFGAIIAAGGKLSEDFIGNYPEQAGRDNLTREVCEQFLIEEKQIIDLYDKECGKSKNKDDRDNAKDDMMCGLNSLRYEIEMRHKTQISREVISGYRSYKELNERPKEVLSVGVTEKLEGEIKGLKI